MKKNKAQLSLDLGDAIEVVPVVQIGGLRLELTHEQAAALLTSPPKPRPIAKVSARNAAIARSLQARVRERSARGVCLHCEHAPVEGKKLCKRHLARLLGWRKTA